MGTKVLKKYQYTVLPPVGSGKTKKTGTLLDLLESVPYFLTKKRWPSLKVINDVLNKGSHDAGMSGGSRWTPFTIDADEYKVLTAESIKKGYSVATLPSWVKTQSDFHIWEFEVDYDVPAKEHKKLTEKERVLEEKYKRAVCEGREKDAEKLYAQKYEAGVKLGHFMEKYLKR